MTIDIIAARCLVISGNHALSTTDPGLWILLILPFDEPPRTGLGTWPWGTVEGRRGVLGLYVMNKVAEWTT